MEHYQAHLDRVSRSFAFCIEQLDENFRESISVAYLILRLLDTIEDSKWPAPEAQVEAFRKFCEFLSGPASAEDLAEWVRSFPSGLSDGEALLVADCATVFSGFHRLEPMVRQRIAETAVEMALGMEHFSTRESGQIQIHDREELDRYCDCVAGIIGRLIVELYHLKYPVSEGGSLHRQAMALGRSLQKINILKDQHSDLRENRHFVPSLPLILESLMSDLGTALPLVIEGFEGNRRLRIFCAWSLGIGLALLPQILLGVQKSSRAATEQLKEFLADHIDSPTHLREFFALQHGELDRAVKSLG